MHVCLCVFVCMCVCVCVCVYVCVCVCVHDIHLYVCVFVYHMRIKFSGLIFVFDQQENSWSINFCDHGGVVVIVIVGFASYYNRL